MHDVTEQLERYGEALQQSIEASAAAAPAPELPSMTEAPRRDRRARSVVAAAALVALVVSVGVIVMLRIGDEPDPAERPAGPPRGAPVAHLRIEALPSLSYQAEEFTTIAGINDVEFVDLGGTHTLVFDDPALSYFGLAVPQGPTVGKVRLKAGRDYRIGDVIAGHRAAGMHAVVHVLSKAELRGAAEPPAGCQVLLPEGTGGCDVSRLRAERWLGFRVLGPARLPASWRVIRRNLRASADSVPTPAPGGLRVYNRIWGPPETDLTSTTSTSDVSPYLQLRVRVANAGDGLRGPTVDLAKERVATGDLRGSRPGSSSTATLDWIEDGKMYHLVARGMTEVQIRTALASMR